MRGYSTLILLYCVINSNDHGSGTLISCARIEAVEAGTNTPICLTKLRLPRHTATGYPNRTTL